MAAMPQSLRSLFTIMAQRTRKQIGTLLILLSLVVWGWVGTFFYMQVFAGLPPLALIAYFAVAGGSWFFPAARIIRWMSAPDRASPR